MDAPTTQLITPCLGSETVQMESWSSVRERERSTEYGPAHSADALGREVAGGRGLVRRRAGVRARAAGPRRPAEAGERRSHPTPPSMQAGAAARRGAAAQAARRGRSSGSGGV